jgi:hypothetical protein
MHIDEINGSIVPVGSSDWIVKKEDYAVLEFFIKVNPSELKGWKTEFNVDIMEGDKKIKSVKAKFIGPEKYN